MFLNNKKKFWAKNFLAHILICVILGYGDEEYAISGDGVCTQWRNFWYIFVAFFAKIEK
jgi:hypothetical protein